MTTTSNPGAILLRRKTSRMSRFARFRWTAPPSLRVAAMPSRPTVLPFGRRKTVLNRLNPGAPLVDLLEFRTAANALVWAEPQLLAADGQALTALGPPSLQHEAAVFSAHTHEKPMRLLAMTRIGLKSPDSLGHDIPSRCKRNFNGSGSVRGVSITSECATVCLLHSPGPAQSIHARLVSRQSFPHLWKNLWKFAENCSWLSNMAVKRAIASLARACPLAKIDRNGLILRPNI
jgi:hypothetical protein